MNDDTTLTTENNAEVCQAGVKIKQRLHPTKRKKTTFLSQCINMKANEACKKSVNSVNECDVGSGIQYTNGTAEWSSNSTHEEFISLSLKNGATISDDAEENNCDKNLKVKNCNRTNKYFKPLECPTLIKVTSHQSVSCHAVNVDGCFNEKYDRNVNHGDKIEPINVLNQKMIASYAKYENIPEKLLLSSYITFSAEAFIKHLHNAFPHADNKLGTEASSAKSSVNETLHDKPNNFINDSSYMSPTKIHQTLETIGVQISPRKAVLKHAPDEGKTRLTLSPNNASKRVIASPVNNKINESKNGLLSPLSENVNAVNAKSPTNRQENVSGSSPVKPIVALLESPNQDMRIFLNNVNLTSIVPPKQDSNATGIQNGSPKAKKPNTVNCAENIALADVEGTSVPFKNREIDSVEKNNQKSSKGSIQSSLQNFNVENTINNKDDDPIPTHVSNTIVGSHNKFRKLNKIPRTVRKNLHSHEIINPDTLQKSDNPTSCIPSLRTTIQSTPVEPKSVKSTNELSKKLFDLKGPEVTCNIILDRNSSCGISPLSKSSKKQKMQTLKRIKTAKDIIHINKELTVKTSTSKKKRNNIFKTPTEEEEEEEKKRSINIALPETSKEDSETMPKIQNCPKEQKIQCIKNTVSVSMINFSTDHDLLDYEATDTEEIPTKVHKELPISENKEQSNPEYPKFNGMYTNQTEFMNITTLTVPTSASKCTLDNKKEGSPAIINTTENIVDNVITSTEDAVVDASSKSNKPSIASMCKETDSRSESTDLFPTSKYKEVDISCGSNKMHISSDYKEPDISCRSNELPISNDYKEPDISCRSNELPISSEHKGPDITTSQNKKLTAAVESKEADEACHINRLSSNVKYDQMQGYCNANEVTVSDRLSNQRSTCGRFRYLEIDDSSESELSGMEDNYTSISGYQHHMTFYQPYKKPSLPESKKNDFPFKKPISRKPNKISKSHSTPKKQDSSCEFQIFAPALASEIDDNPPFKRPISPKSLLSSNVEVERKSDSSGEKVVRTEDVDIDSHNVISPDNCSKEKDNSQSSSYRATSPVVPNCLPLISLKGYCKLFLKTGFCSLKCCKYIHKNPLQAPQAVPAKKGPEFIADPRKIVPGFSQTVSVIEESCISGLLKKAFDDSWNFFRRNPPSEHKNQVIKLLLKASVDMGNQSHLHNILEIFKDFHMLDKVHCSKFIMACSSKPRKTFDSAVKMFNACADNKITLQDTAVTALHDIFCLDRTQWNLTLRLMLYKNTVCHQNIQMQELEDALTICVHGSETRSDMKFILESLSSILQVLSDVEFKQLLPEKVRALISLLKRYKFPRNIIEGIEWRTNKYFGIPKLPNHTDANQLPHFNVPAANPIQQVSILQKISSAVEKKEWHTVVQIFRQCVSRLDYQPLMHLQLSLLSKDSDIVTRFSGFIKALTSTHDVHGIQELTLQERYLLTQIGVTLLQETHQNRNMQTAYSIIKLLHRHNLNYFEIQQANPKRRMLLSHPELKRVIVYSWNIALVAVEVCLSNKCPLDALSIMSGFHKMSDDTVDTENCTEVARDRVQLLIKINHMLLKQKKELFYCEEALKYLVAFTTDDSYNFLSEKDLEEVKYIFNRYLAECMNSQNIEKAEELLKTMTHRELFSDIKPMILRGLLVKYYSIGKEKKAEALFKKCSLAGLYSLTIPNVQFQPREICLSTEWTYYELRVIFNDVFKKFYETLNSYKQNTDFEKWFSLSFKFEEPPASSDHQFLVDGICDVSTHVNDFRVRVMKALNDMAFSWKNDNVMENRGQHSLKIESRSLYQKFIQWKNNSEIKDPSNVSANSSFEFLGQTPQKFGSFRNRSLTENELGNSNSEILDNEVPQPVPKKPCLKKGISHNKSASSNKSSSLSSDQELPPKKSKIQYKKALTSGTFSYTEAKNANLRISVNSDGRDITNDSDLNESDSAEDVSQTEKYVSPNKNESSSLLKNFSERTHLSPKHPRYGWINPNFNPSIKRKLQFCEETITLSNSQDEQTFSANLSTPAASSSAATNFKEIKLNSAFNPFSPSESFTKSDHSHRSKSKPHRVKHKITCRRAKVPLNQTFPSTSLHSVNSISDTANSGVEQLHASLMMLINQKYQGQDLSLTEKERITNELLENFLSKFKVTEKELSERKTKLNLIKFTQDNL